MSIRDWSQTAEKAEEIANKQEFLEYLGEHATAQIIGAESRQQAIRDTIKEFNEKRDSSICG